MVKRDESHSSGHNTKRLTTKELQELLIENFVGLQKAMTNLSIKFESLTEQITKLLEIYELSARNFIEGAPAAEADQDLLGKVDSLLDQNKTIAKGLILIEEKLRNRADELLPQASSGEEPRHSYARPKPLPRI